MFIAPTANVIGNVEMGDSSSMWFGAVARGDSDSIEIGKGSNIQDNAVLHVDPGFPLRIGNHCTVGHGAIVHGAELDDHVLVGMNAVVLNGVKIGKYCIVGANALVTSNTDIPEGSMVLGSPAKVIRMLSEEERRGVERNAAVYVEKAAEYIAHYKKNPVR